MRAAAALLLLLAAPAGAADPDRWHETLSPHFTIKHESAFAPAGVTLELEKLHNRLRLDLSMFAPWMAKERINLFLYASQGSYLKGRFTPPSWSNGVAFYQMKTVATFWGQGPKQYQVLGHETTHLLFEGYWGEVNKTPPVWLNEGLAMMEETGDADAGKSDWQAALDNMDLAELMPVDRFIKVVPTRDLKDDKNRVAVWYVEAFGLVRFLYHGRSRMQFFNFCAQLREGRPIEDALWRVYRLRGTQGLEKEFLASLKRRGGGSARPSASFGGPAPAARPAKEGTPMTLKPVGFSGGGYRGLMPDEKKR